jgi:leucyl aminopeptidase
MNGITSGARRFKREKHWIMDFELKTLSLGGAAAEKCDALLVLVPEGFKPAKDGLSKLVASALAARDLETKPGKLLQAYRSEGVSAPRLILAGAGDGSGKKVHAAVQAAVGAIRSAGVKRLVICLPEGAGDDAVRAAVCATAETSYVYVATKSKPEGRELQRITIAVADAGARKKAFAAARGRQRDRTRARTGQPATEPRHAHLPGRRGEEARQVVRSAMRSDGTQGDREDRHGVLPVGCARLARAAPLHRAALPGRRHRRPRS